MSLTTPHLERCPVCGHESIDCDWIPEYRQFLVRCPKCTVYSIERALAVRFGQPLFLKDRVLLERLSAYLGNAGEDDDREITEASWRRLAVES